MKKKVDLVSGNILKTLVTLSLPILGTAFIQMAYSLVDMIWIGRAGSAAVAAVGTAGFFSWFGNSLVTISKTGAEVGVSQAIGKNNSKERNEYVYSSLFLCITMAIIYGILLIVFRDGLIGFFNLGDETIIRMSKEYLIVIALGMICAFINPQLTGIFTASGNSKTPFIVNTIGLVMNIVLDPILIFGMFNIKPLGVVGAALATVFSQLIVSLIFIYTFIKHGYNISFNNRKYINRKIIKRVCKYGGPTAIQNCLFTFFSMLIGRVVAMAGPVSIAVQKVGSQIESISWMTAGGFSSALTAFVGQNYGAKRNDRVLKGYVSTLFISCLVGVFATVLLVFAGEQLFRLFINESEAIIQGADYLRILGYSQLFMCLEITTAGAFYGIGKTMTPSLISIIFTGLRVPVAIILFKPELLGINGVWWSISGSSIIKGIILVILFYFMFIKKINKSIA
ncbi:MATE family efflux transporter [Clostridium celatum]|uniref:MATE family efflux transporter n=2 Tax=Clostridium celatum TaxID=36834 RepID=UPI00189B9467|nr:MATE family efflux transporter [Clostridium celatum]MDU6295756.1 MATE family efflux transporter [Clostridium celatum]MDY3361540.1 MATE family efflux transporter [Clostridium celatum]